MPLFPLPSAGHQVGDYLLLEEVARGGMGVIFQALQLSLGRTVALKMVLRGEFAQPDDLARFRAEARAIAQLHHPNLVAIIEVGEYHGLPFYAMEYLPGGPLSRRLGGHPLAPPAAARLLLPLAEAVEFAHGNGVVHRDLKPSNVLLADDAPVGSGVAKLTDFGIAKRLDDQSGLTRTGEVLGTPGYMAPEQARGDAVGPAADVYSLGTILYEALTGRPPFTGPDPAATLMQVMHQDPEPPRAFNPCVPADLETITLKCLEKDPGRRYASAADLADDLRRFLADEPIRARPASPPERARKWVRRNPVVATAAAAAAVLAVTGVGAMTSSWRQAEARAALQAQMREVKERNLVEVRALLADALLERGIGLAEKQDVGRGLHWMLRSLELAEAVAPHDPRGAPLAEAARYNLAHWGEQAARPAVELRHEAWAWDVRFSPDGRRAVTASADGKVRVWDADTGAPVGVPLAHDGPVWAVRPHPSGDYLFSAAGDEAGELRVHRADRATPGGFLPMGLPARTPMPITQLTVSPDGSALGATPPGGPTVLYTFDPGADPPLKPVGPLGAGPGLGVRFSPDSKTAYYATQAGEVAAYRLPGRAPALAPWKLDRPLTALAGSAGGERLAVASYDPEANTSAVHVWELNGERHLDALTYPGRVKRMAFSPCGRRLAVSTYRKQGDQIRGAVCLAEVEGPGKWAPLYPPIEHPGPVWALAFHPSGRQLLTGCEDRHARLFEVATGLPLAAPHNQGGNVTNVAFSADGRRYIIACAGAGDSNERAVVREVPGYGVAPRLFAPTRPIRFVQWRQGGEGLFAIDESWGVVQLAGDGRFVRTVRTGKEVGHPRFAPPGMLRSLTPDQRMILTDLETDETAFISTTPVHWHDSHGTQFDGRVILFDRKTNRLNLHPLWGRPGPIAGVPLEVPMETHFTHPGAPAFGGPVFGGTMAVRRKAGGGVPARDGALVRIWDRGLNELRAWELPYGLYGAFLSPSGDMVGLLGGTRVRFLDVATGKPVGAGITVEESPVQLCFHPTERIALIGHLNGLVTLWHVPTSKRIGKAVQASIERPFLSARPDGSGYLFGSGQRRAVECPHVGPKAGTVDELRGWIERLTGITRDEAEEGAAASGG